MELPSPQSDDHDDDSAPPLNEREASSTIIKPLPFDAQTYWRYLDGLDISNDERAALLEALWNIARTFVDIAFGLDPVQHVIPALVQAAWDDENQNRQHFNSAVAGQNIRKEDDQHE